MAGWPAAVTALSLALLSPGRTSPLPQDTPGGVLQRIGSTCSSRENCQQVDNGFCNRTTGTCQCLSTHPIPNEISCLKAAIINETCTITSQCRSAKNAYAECVRGVCTCGADSYPHTFADSFTTCLLSNAEARKDPVDPVTIAILASLVLMFVIICVVLRLFSKAQFRQNRTILNSANPRLMNASFLKGSLIKSPVEQIRGSRSSRGSRAPSLTSLERAGGAPPSEHEERRSSLAKTKADEAADASHVQVEVTRHGH